MKRREVVSEAWATAKAERAARRAADPAVQARRAEHEKAAAKRARDNGTEAPGGLARWVRNRD